MTTELNEIDLGIAITSQMEGSIIVIKDGKAYLKRLPKFGMTEITTKNGQIIMGNDRIGWKI